MKLDVKALGLSLGIVWGVSVFVIGISAPVCLWAMHFVDVLAPFYIGFQAGLIGSIIGAVWGFIDAAIGGVLIGWLYNKFAKS